MMSGSSDEDSSDEEQAQQEFNRREGFFELAQKYAAKKELPEVDHSKVEYHTFKKNFYIQVKNITAMKEHEVEHMRKANGNIKVRGKHCPRPIWDWTQIGLPDKVI